LFTLAAVFSKLLLTLVYMYLAYLLNIFLSHRYLLEYLLSLMCGSACNLLFLNALFLLLN